MKRLFFLFSLFLALSCTTDERLDEIEELQSQIEQLLASLENSEIDSASAQAALEALQAQLSELQTEIESEIEESEDADEGEYGLTIGDDFYPMTRGYTELEAVWPDYEFGDGDENTCDNISELEDDHYIYLEFYQNSVNYDSNWGITNGSGKIIEFYIYTDTENIKDGEYNNIKNLINDIYGTRFETNSALWDSDWNEYEELDDICYSLSGYVDIISYYTFVDGDYSNEIGPGGSEDVTLIDGGELTFKRRKNEVTVTFEGLGDESNLPVLLNFKGTLSEVTNSSKSMRRNRRK